MGLGYFRCGMETPRRRSASGDRVDSASRTESAKYGCESERRRSICSCRRRQRLATLTKFCEYDPPSVVLFPPYPANPSKEASTGGNMKLSKETGGNPLSA